MRRKEQLQQLLLEKTIHVLSAYNKRQTAFSTELQQLPYQSSSLFSNVSTFPLHQTSYNLHTNNQRSNRDFFKMKIKYKIELLFIYLFFIFIQN